MEQRLRPESCEVRSDEVEHMHVICGSGGAYSAHVHVACAVVAHPTPCVIRTFQIQCYKCHLPGERYCAPNCTHKRDSLSVASGQECGKWLPLPR